MRGYDEIRAAYEEACGDRSAVDGEAEARLDLDQAGSLAAALENADKGSLPVLMEMRAAGMPASAAMRAVCAAAFNAGVMTGVQLERNSTTNTTPEGAAS